MPTFSYQAISETGETVSGAIEADSVDAAENLLFAKGYIPSKITRERNAGNNKSWSDIMGRIGGVTTSDIIIFTKQFRSMLSAGVPIIKLLQTLGTQTQNHALKSAISSIIADIKQGSTLFDAMSRYPKIFSHLYCNMVRAGETSGNLPDVLSRLIYIIEHEAKIKSDIRSALQYPFIVLIALGIAFFILLTFVVPKFITIFARAGITLPLPTRIAMLMYQVLSAYWYYLIGGIIILIAGLRYYFNTEEGRFQRDAFLLKIPILGSLFVKSAMSRFASIFAILQSSGIPVMNAITILSGTIGNAAISRTFNRIKEQLEEGRGISTPLRAAKYFTPMVIDMIAIGEESGNIEEMLREITKHYDDEVEYAVKGLSGAIGPVLIVGLAAVVGFFAMAIFLPMWDMTKMTTR
ncbi:MAG: general secretion pathway protein GspF [Deltaproteobacteria bacterium GWC2_42_11]|nr:MAG: general secretion pathway protein GspF [Deltaproteobacteria bacterium GWC2_42_11]